MMRTPKESFMFAAAAFLLVAVLAGCGPSPAISLSLDSSAATVLRGASVDVLVTLARSGGASADVLLSTDLQPTDEVTAAFSAATLTGSILTSTLTLSVPADAAAGPLTVTVAADGSGLAASQTFTLTIASLSVNGAVHGLMSVPQVGVTVSSQAQSTVTGPDGTFELEGLSVPYDLTVSNTAGNGFVQRFEGMTVADPSLKPFPVLATVTLPMTASLSGNLTGGVLPLPANHALVVCVEGTTFVVYGCDRLTAAESSYAIPAMWQAGASASVRIHAIEYSIDGAGEPVSYLGYGTATATLSDGGTPTQDIALGAAPSTTTLSATASLPVGVPPSIVVGSLRISDKLAMVLFQNTAASGTISVPMPVLPGATYDLLVGGMAPGIGASVAWVRGVEADVGTIVGPAVSALVVPADGVSNVTTATEFTVAAPDDGVSTFVWQPDAAGPTFAVSTTKATATIPSAPGLALPAAAAYTWTVYSAPNQPTVGASEAGGFDGFYAFILGSSLGGPGVMSDGALTITGDSRDFTTAP